MRRKKPKVELIEGKAGTWIFWGSFAYPKGYEGWNKVKTKKNKKRTATITQSDGTTSTTGVTIVEYEPRDGFIPVWDRENQNFEWRPVVKRDSFLTRFFDFIFG